MLLLCQVLDIGGAAQQPSFADSAHTEVPPIPCHVHAGTVVDGKIQGTCRLLFAGSHSTVAFILRQTSIIKVPENLRRTSSRPWMLLRTT